MFAAKLNGSFAARCARRIIRITGGHPEQFSAEELERRRLLAPLVVNGSDTVSDIINVSYFSGTTYLRVTKNGTTTDYTASSYDGIQP